ncbi:pyridoxamine 5'-phosphate oxidase family protein [Haloarchaeobius amylolyticus]|uniref:pyridoxamine 5'-phosphate oxidase family protein n=1 Tax=Haloarchaeobius amylolyticus TaxID=1198296 RepID=UPI002270F04D|nr:pyridoxamine 5'-phosphate oxidase family protein [Haloarchaeobius amylolyticus]
MEDIRSVQMDDETRNEFLGRGGTGVISLSTDADQAPYSIPVSYGFDAEEETFYFRLAFGADSTKADLLDRDTHVSFVTFEQTGEGWKSVVARGQLASITEGAVGTEILDRMRHIHIPLVDTFDRDPQELSFEFYRMQPYDLAGKQEAHTES